MSDWKEKFGVVWKHWIETSNRHSAESAAMHREIKLMRAVIQNQAETIMVQAKTIKALRRKA